MIFFTVLVILSVTAPFWMIQLLKILEHSVVGFMLAVFIILAAIAYIFPDAYINIQL